MRLTKNDSLGCVSVPGQVQWQYVSDKLGSMVHATATYCPQPLRVGRGSPAPCTSISATESSNLMGSFSVLVT